MAATIRRAREEDAEALVEIGGRMFAVAHRDAFSRVEDLQTVIARDWYVERLLGEIRDPDVEVFVAEVDGAPVGLTGLRPGPVPNSDLPGLELCRVYLDDGHFGRGIGAALLDAAMDHLRVRGEPDCWLIAWEDNERAIPMYVSRGFVRTAEFPYVVGESAPTAVLMERPGKRALDAV
jgi:ribosomal protein S18 acetylase RimI-like enzyme